MTARKSKRDDDDFKPVFAGSHVHTAEVHGESETLNLRPWARAIVLAAADPRR